MSLKIEMCCHVEIAKLKLVLRRNFSHKISLEKHSMKKYKYYTFIKNKTIKYNIFYYTFNTSSKTFIKPRLFKKKYI